MATYLVETPLSLEDVAEIIAGEQSTGTFTKIKGDRAVNCHRAQVLSVESMSGADRPSLPSAYLDRYPHSGKFQRGRVQISFPFDNVGANLPAWLATVAGNLFELGELTAIRLQHLEFPDVALECAYGPQFGITGTRDLIGRHTGPIVGTIIKPSVGFSPDQYAERTHELLLAGIDFIKDDELMSDPPHCPFYERVDAVMDVINRFAERTGRRAMYAFNLTDECDAMRQKHDHVLKNGGTCVMVCLNSVGLAGLESLRKTSKLPIHGHRSGWGALTRSPDVGMDFQPYQLFNRLAGADHIHVSGIDGKFWDSDEIVGAAGRTCLTSLGERQSGQPVLPAVSSGQWGGQAPETLREFQSDDLIYLAGGGIQGHPDGMKAGIEAIRAAWLASKNGTPLFEAAKTSKPLARSIEFFGR